MISNIVEMQIRQFPRKIINGMCPSCGKKVGNKEKNCIKCFQILEK